jgi:hypothetical protein
MKSLQLAAIANALTIKLTLDQQPTDRASIRDYCDLATASNLDCWVLDLLTDMVTKRLGSHRA